MKYLLVFFGIISLSLGIAGIFLPVLPTTPFLLLSATLFARSSEQLYNRLLNHPVLGEYIRDFLKEKAIPLRIKIFSVSIMWTAMLCTIFFAVNKILWLQILLFAVAISITIHILSYKTKNKPNQNETETKTE
ncbi:MAG: YbaN family protein [Dysgonamonadaceae bacterium]|nr:YbaN family protein [Dysgonamonadaceae bacterium]